MKGTCPITGDTADVTERTGRVVVEHPQLGGYEIDADAVPDVESDVEGRERLAQWIVESHSLGIAIPKITIEHVRIFEPMADLDAAISEWVERRNTVASVDEERLWRKLRLEWNYNSNHIEGNTLTYAETELLLIHGRTGGGRPMRDYEEMKAHDVAIEYTRQLARSGHPLRQSDIRDLNKILLKEPFWASAETPDGRPTRKRIVPGQYKTLPNHVRTATGELHRFAEPEETPALMEEWTRDFQRDVERSTYPLPLFLAESHWRFLRIHPFDDGNGRTARLLVNYLLLRRDLPPMVIRSTDRDRYIGGLQNADVGRMLPLTQFMLENTLWSLATAIRAAKGESIQEPGDIDKEIAVFVRRNRGSEPDASDIGVVDDVVSNSVRPTVEKMEAKLESLRQLFHDSNWGSSLWTVHTHVTSSALFDRKSWEQTKRSFVARPGFKLDDQRQVQLMRELKLSRYVGRGREGFSIKLSMIWKLQEERFSFEAQIDGETIASIRYRLRYSELESQRSSIDATVDEICNAMMNKIDRRSK
ncbi:MAG: Fic family protein [Acidobacteriota bacterium]|nr:Fic family protein [Acidobacteriota bacterium]